MALGNGGVHFLVGIGKPDVKVMFEGGEQGSAAQGDLDETCKFIRWEIADFECERFISRVPDPFNLDQSTKSIQAQPGGYFRLAFDNLCDNHLRTRCQPAARHLLRITHQLVEMNSWRSDKRAGTAAALHNPLPLKPCQSVPRRHEAHPMNSGQFAFGVNRVARPQFLCFDPLAQRVLNLFIRGQTVPTSSSHEYLECERFVVLHLLY